MNSGEEKIVVSCLDCQNPIELEFQPVRGQIIICQHCTAELEIINAEPLELDFYYEEWEDDEDEDDDEDDDEDEDPDDARGYD